MPSSFPATAAALLLLALASPAPPTVIKPSEAASYVGQEVTVERLVAKVTVSRRSGTTYLNFDAPLPKQTFTAVIFKRSRDLFPKAREWEGKRIAVSGMVQLYRRKPEIILERSEQVRFAE